MKKSILILLAVTAFFTFSTGDSFAESIMFDRDNNLNRSAFPDMADYSPEKKTDTTTNSTDIPVQPAIWPFSGKDEDDSEQVKQKSTRKAFFLSLLLPGLGETYVGSKRGLIFMFVEAFSWWTYISNTNEGKDLEDDFKLFANANWTYYYNDPADADKYSYWEWLKRTYKMNEFSGGEMQSDEYLKPTDYDEINAHVDKMKDSTGSSVHNLPSTKTQQYYEMIGKYDQFVYGWEDIGDHNSSLVDENKIPNGKYDENTQEIKSPIRIKYMDLRAQSNNKLYDGQRGIHLMIINRVLSAIDAGRLAYHHNKKLESDLSMIRVRVAQKHIIDHNVPMFVVSKKF